jgi:hypothetical protein
MIATTYAINISTRKKKNGDNMVMKIVNENGVHRHASIIRIKIR